MVLHNDKWKYKARRNYMRKHGLKTLERDKDKRKNRDTNEKDEQNHEIEDKKCTKTSTGTEETSATEEEQNDNEEKTLDGEEDDISEDNNDGEGEITKKKLGSNSWRFEADTQDEIELMKDPELIEAEKQRRDEEQKLFNKQKDVVLQHIMEVGEDDSAYKNVMRKEDREGRKDSDKDFLEELIKAFDDGRRQQSEETKYSSNEKMTPEERQQFFRLQKEIKHQKMVLNAKGGYSQPKMPRKGRSIELDLDSDANNYRDIVAQKLNEGIQKINIEDTNFEEDLKELVGDSASVDRIDRNKNKVKNNNYNAAFDLDKLISGDNKDNKEQNMVEVSRLNNEGNRQPTGKMESISKEDEQFLDDILGA